MCMCVPGSARAAGAVNILVLCNTQQHFCIISNLVTNPCASPDEKNSLVNKVKFLGLLPNMVKTNQVARLLIHSTFFTAVKFCISTEIF